jgi:hypothetical protein
MKSDEFWDYEKQVDLEAFSCNEFYSILSKQSRDVTSSIARQKDQVNYRWMALKKFYEYICTVLCYCMHVMRNYNAEVS